MHTPLTTRLTDLQRILTATRAALATPAQPGETAEDRAALVLATLDTALTDLVGNAHLLALAPAVAVAQEVNRG